MNLIKKINQIHEEQAHEELDIKIRNRQYLATRKQKRLEITKPIVDEAMGQFFESGILELFYEAYSYLNIQSKFLHIVDGLDYSTRKGTDVTRLTLSSNLPQIIFEATITGDKRHTKRIKAHPGRGLIKMKFKIGLVKNQGAQVYLDDICIGGLEDPQIYELTEDTLASYIAANEHFKQNW